MRWVTARRYMSAICQVSPSFVMTYHCLYWWSHHMPVNSCGARYYYCSLALCKEIVTFPPSRVCFCQSSHPSKLITTPSVAEAPLSCWNRGCQLPIHRTTWCWEESECLDHPPVIPDSLTRWLQCSKRPMIVWLILRNYTCLRLLNISADTEVASPQSYISLEAKLPLSIYQIY